MSSMCVCVCCLGYVFSVFMLGIFQESAEVNQRLERGFHLHADDDSEYAGFVNILYRQCILYIQEVGNMLLVPSSDFHMPAWHCTDTGTSKQKCRPKILLRFCRKYQAQIKTTILYFLNGTIPRFVYTSVLLKVIFQCYTKKNYPKLEKLNTVFSAT